jgi:tetratricopeptide (TPR) repeat protein
LNSRGGNLKADSLFVSGQYFEASIEYERLIFSSANQNDLYHYKYKKGLCYKHLKYFDRAIEELQPIYFSDPKDSLYLFVNYELAVCYYLNREPKKAFWKIDEYMHRNPDTTTYKFFMPVRLLCLNETLQWSEAHKCLIRLVQMQDFSPEKEAEMLQVVNNLYLRKNLPHIKSGKKAENLSRFLPGLGQTYAGYAGEGIVNFLINTSLLAFSAQQFFNGFYITGYFAGLGLFNKTYHGGIKRSGILSARKNTEQLVHFNGRINQILRSDFNLN